MIKTLAGVALFLTAISAQAQSLADALRGGDAGGWSGYIFISSTMPRSTVLSLAKQASRANINLVLNGFVHDGPKGFKDTQEFVARLNRDCCEKHGAHWMIDPLLFNRYKVARVPAFVLGRGESNNGDSFTKVYGEMGLGEALQLIAQGTQIPGAKRYAAALYSHTFAE